MKVRTRDLVLYAMLGALMFALKMAMAWMPNIEPVSLLTLACTAVFGRRALYPVAVYVILEYLVWGFGVWSACYLYVWPLLVLLGLLMRGMKSRLGWAVLSGAYGLCFGALCAPVYLVTGGWAAALSWWVSGIPYDILHCAGNFVMALVLLQPCTSLLQRLAGNRETET